MCSRGRLLFDAIEETEGNRDRLEGLILEALPPLAKELATVMHEAQTEANGPGQRIAVLEQQLSAHEAQVAGLNEQLDAAAAHAQQQQVHTNQLTRTLSEQDELLRKVRRQVEQYRSDVVLREAQLAAASQELERVRASKSWRLTAPLRWISTRLRRKGG